MNEHDLEELAMAWFDKIGYQIAHGPDIEPGGSTQERADYQEVILWNRFDAALERLNPDAPASVLRDAKRNFRRRLGEETNLIRSNRVFQEMLTEGIRIEHREGGETRTIAVRLIAREDLELNDYLAVNQVTVHHDRNHRIPDIVVFINGLPISVIELKSFVRERVTLLDAFKQLETYKKEIPLLFQTNQILVASNGVHSRFGSLTSGWDRFMPWRAMGFEFKVEMELEFMLNELFNKEMLIEYIFDFVLFQSKRTGPVKIIAGYHQYHAAKAALERTTEEVMKQGRGRIGVIWHTQGSGKSLTMTFLTGLIAREKQLGNPTVLVVTDRKDLDGQLFQTFDSAKDYLRQEPIQIEDKNDLVTQLSGRKFGGVIFSTIQKFLPKEAGARMELLSDRTNIVIMADEAHRSQYDMLDGFAAHLNDAFPNASFIGFTGTPISFEDRDTRGVFGDDISIYDLKQSILDESTVNIYYDKQVRKLFTSKESEAIDEAFEAATDGEETAVTERAKRRWSRLEAAFGAENRLKEIVAHMVPHIQSRAESFPKGKSMIVCATRRICVRLHDLLKEAHPEWYSEKDEEGAMKVIMTGSAADSAEWGEHIRSSSRRGTLGDRFRDTESDFKIAIVCDMWLTGFDAPSLSTMYIDKPMKGHGLMQALARVNRAFKDKEGGVIVDYFGLSARIAEAVNHYTASKGRGKVVLAIEEAELILIECHGVVKDMFHTIDHSEYWITEPLEKERIRRQMLDRINTLVSRDPEASKRRFGHHVSRLNKAWNLAKASNAARALRDDIKLYQALHGYINQKAPEEQKDPGILDSAIQQILDDTITSEGLVDIVGIGNERSIFDDAFLARVKEIEEKNLAQAALEQLLRGQILTLKSANVVQSRKFSEMLESTLKRYRDGDLEDIQNVIDELLELGTQMKAANDRGEDLGLTYEELAFYDALEDNEVAVRQMGEGKLSEIAKAMAERVKELWTVDWAFSERKQAEFRVMLRDLLEEYGYPPEECERAVETVLEQAKLTARNHDIYSAVA